jgi:serine phosphatase RsbU (regulator of sigma subunit)
MVAGRYKEATLNYRHLSQALSEWGMVPTLDNIQLYMLPKYRANVEAGRRDSAQVVGRYILSELDEAISKQVNSTTAELATIYDTQGKDAEIARQQVDMAKQRLLSTGIALVLLITFFLIYTLNKRKAAHKLAAAHRSLEEAHANLEDAHSKLQSAYDELEKTTKAKERIESELRIARDIQMSMVPNIFPDAEGIDLYAAMLPAKEVGGDLYGYLLQGKELYFCVGDVSGKGVPASLFMAQATRLFRTLAAQHMKPAEIANQMNAALTENNEQGMFITMFIGFIDLSTGHMDYCNAGHNPPIIGMEPTFLDVEPSAPIGIWEGMEYVGESLDNIMDIPIFVYSDGLNEAENAQQEQLGDERVLEFLRSHPFTSSKQTVEMLKEEVEKHRAGAERNDDLTMLSLRVTSSSPGRR